MYHAIASTTNFIGLNFNVIINTLKFNCGEIVEKHTYGVCFFVFKKSLTEDFVHMGTTAPVLSSLLEF
jgi:hypothetical protein